LNPNKTKVWQYYEAGRAYNNGLTPNQYRLVNTNIEFFAGNQWLHMPETPAMSRLPKPTFNVIKRVTSLFVASLTSSATSISFEPLAYYDGNNVADPDSDAAAFATSEVQNLLEKFKMDYRVREAMFDGAQTGDYCAHFYWDPNALPYGGAYGPYRGEIKMELVDGLNVMFGNPNNREVEDQPYILLIGRDTVENLCEEAKRNQKFRPKDEGDFSDFQIEPDYDTQWQAGIGGRHELIPDDDGHGKALYCYMYFKVTKEEDVLDPKTGMPMMETVTDSNGDPVPAKDEDGSPIIKSDGTPVYKTKKVKQLVTSVHVTKATKTCTIFEDVDTGLSRYPIAWGNWERQKNQYHGRALVTGIIPNQIFINSMFAMVFRHLQLMGFPKYVYNADIISQWTNEVGQAIGVRGLQPGQPIDQVAYVLQPADMSNQIIAAIDKAVSYTKDCLGATDAQLGNVRPDNTSALMVLQSAAEIPLENTRANMYEWMEDIGAILLDMMGTYYGERPILRDREFEEPVGKPGETPQLDPFTGTLSTNKVIRRVVETFDFTQLKHLWLNVRVNVGATTYFSEIAMVQTLDNLRRDGVLDMIQYLERVPDRLVPQREKLIDDLKAKAQQQERDLAAQQNMQMENGIIPGSDGQAIGSMTEGQEAAFGAAEGMRKKLPPSGTNPVAGGAIDTDKAFASLPPGMQKRFENIPSKRAKDAVLQHGRILAE
jgi:hypothetical protein